MTDRSLLFGFLRHKLGRGLSQAEVDEFDALLDTYDGEGSKAAYALGQPQAFYAKVRELTSSLDQVQVDTVNSLLASASHWPTSWLAYGLATAWHEARLKPIPEYGRGKGRPYGKPGKHGQAQYGRGLVQLTWDANYEKMDAALSAAGVIKKGELLANFDLALRPDIAAFILVHGMERGEFAGDSEGRHTLARHLPHRLGTPAQFTAARRIINGTDRASLIAGYAEHFQKALTAGEWK